MKHTVDKGCVLFGSDLGGCSASSAMLCGVNCRNGNQTQLFIEEHKVYEISKIWMLKNKIARKVPFWTCRWTQAKSVCFPTIHDQKMLDKKQWITANYIMAGAHLNKQKVNQIYKRPEWEVKWELYKMHGVHSGMLQRM